MSCAFVVFFFFQGKSSDLEWVVGIGYLFRWKMFPRSLRYRICRTRHRFPSRSSRYAVYLNTAVIDFKPSFWKNNSPAHEAKNMSMLETLTKTWCAYSSKHEGTTNHVVKPMATSSSSNAYTKRSHHRTHLRDHPLYPRRILPPCALDPERRNLCMGVMRREWLGSRPIVS